jgi:hypothetical protein
MYSKIELFAFADFYHRFAATGLTMDEMLHNFTKYSKKPRDITAPIKAPGKVAPEKVKLKPPSQDLTRMLETACEIRGVSVNQVNGKGRERELVDVRQWVSYVGLVHGFEPPDFLRILKWDRSGIYHKSKKCVDLAETVKDYRDGLNLVLNAFAHPDFIA